MFGIIGIVVVFVMVFGGYMAAGGKFSIILGSVVYEVMIIGGAAAGAFVIANSAAAVKQTLRDMRKVFAGPNWQADDYRDTLVLLFQLIRIARQNPLELERHVENPEESEIFTRFPRILADHEVVEVICDTLRAAGMNYDDPLQVEDLLNKRLEQHLHHAQHSAHALRAMADGMPALGIVAAVLGVIKTMGSIDQPPEVLGKLIGGALVGTFLGVFAAYGFVGPFAARVGSVVEEDHALLQMVRDVLVANLHKHPPNICVEVGRQNCPHHLRPSFNALDEALRSGKQEAA